MLHMIYVCYLILQGPRGFAYILLSCAGSEVYGVLAHWTTFQN